jgi:hypothetical protein
MMINRLGLILLINVFFVALCVSQDNRQFKLILIDNEINIQDTNNENTKDSISWISLPHCSYVHFRNKFERNPKIRKGISISDYWKKELGEKFDSCSIIVLIRYQSKISFSSGGDNIACYLLCDNDKVDIMKTGNKNEKLYSIATTDGEVSIIINDWTLIIKGDNDYLSKSYSLFGNDGPKLINEKLRVREFKKMQENKTKVFCL